MIARGFKAGMILGIGLIMTIVLFPWLDHVRDTQYHPTTPVLEQAVNSGDDANVTIVSDNWSAQSFTVTASYTLDHVRVLVWRTAGSGTLTVAVYDADGSGYPTGSALDSGTVSSGAISLISPGTWQSVTMSDKPSLAVGTYTIVLHYAGTGVVNWRVITAGTGYSWSADAGTSWAHTGGGCECGGGGEPI